MREHKQLLFDEKNIIEYHIAHLLNMPKIPLL